MEGFTIVDGGVAVVVLISAILAYSRGLVREVLSIAGWIAAAAVAKFLTPQVVPLIKEIPVVSDIVGGNCTLSLLVAFALVFAAALIVVSIFTPLFSGMIQRSALGAIDQGFGFLFGMARGVLLVLIAFILYDNIFPVGDRLPMVENSKSRDVLADSQAKLTAMAPSEVPAWLSGQYESFVGQCGSAKPLQTKKTNGSDA